MASMRAPNGRKCVTTWQHSASLLPLPDPWSSTNQMTTVLAYLDPGSGSMILQILAGGVAAVAVTAKLYWNRAASLPADQEGRARNGRAPFRRRNRLGLAPPGRARGDPPRSTYSAPLRKHPARPGAVRSSLPCGRPNTPALTHASSRGAFATPRAGSSMPAARCTARCRRRAERLPGRRGCRPARRRAAGPDGASGGHGSAPRAPRARARRGAAPRAHPVRVLSLRVDVLDAEGRRAGAVGPAARARSSGTWS